MTREEKTQLLVELIKAYEDYINLLSDELNDCVPIAHVHGWRSSRADQGQAARDKIENIKRRLQNETN